VDIGVAATNLSGSAGAGAFVAVKVDGGAAQNIVLGNSATATATTILTAFAGLTGATASLDSSGHLTITSNTTGTSSSIQVLDNAGGGSDAALLTALGLADFTAHSGAAAAGANDFSGAVGTDAIAVRVDGGAIQSITLGTSANTTAASILTAFNTAGGHLV